MFFPASYKTSFLQIEILKVTITILLILNLQYLHFYPQKKYTTPQIEINSMEYKKGRHKKWLKERNEYLLIIHYVPVTM